MESMVEAGLGVATNPTALKGRWRMQTAGTGEGTPRRKTHIKRSNKTRKWSTRRRMTMTMRKTVAGRGGVGAERGRNPWKNQALPRPPLPVAGTTRTQAGAPSEHGSTMIGVKRRAKGRVKDRDRDRNRGRGTSKTRTVHRVRAVEEGSKAAKASKAEETESWDLCRCWGGRTEGRSR